MLHFEEHDFVVGAGVDGEAGKHSFELIEGHGEEAKIVLPLVGLVMMREDGAQGTDVACAAHVLRRRDLLEVGGAVVGSDTVDVVDLHARGTFADPCFVHGDVTSFGMERAHVLVVVRTAFGFAWSVGRVGGCLFGDGTLGDQEIFRLVIDGLPALGAVKLRIALIGSGVAVSTKDEAFVGKFILHVLSHNH